MENPRKRKIYLRRQHGSRQAREKPVFSESRVSLPLVGRNNPSLEFHPTRRKDVPCRSSSPCGLASQGSSIGTAGQLTAAGASPLTFEQSGGTLDVDGTLNGSGLDFQYLGGDIDGTVKPEVLTIGANSGNSGTFKMIGGTLNGDIRAGQTVILTANNNSALVETPGNLTNSGTLIVESPAGQTGRARLRLNGGLGTLTNAPTGVVRAIGDNNELNEFSGFIVNEGQFFVEGTGITRVLGDTTNRGSFRIEEDATYFMIVDTAFFQDDGTLDILGRFNGNQVGAQGEFGYFGGELNGIVELKDASLSFGTFGQGDHTILVKNNGTLSTDVPQGVSIEFTSTLTTNTTAALTAPDSITIGGHLKLGNTETTGNGTELHVNGRQVLTISPTGVFEVGGVSGVGGGRKVFAEVDNQGLFEAARNVTIGRAGNGDNHVNSGTMIVNDGFINFEGDTFTNQLGGTLSGAGEFRLDATDFINAGTISPGNSPGFLAFTVNNFTQAASGTLLIEVLNAAHDQINGIVNANLGGTLEVNFLPGHVPISGLVYTVLAGAAINGGFDSVKSDSTGPTNAFIVNQQADKVDVETVANATNVAAQIDTAPSTGDAGSTIQVNVTESNTGNAAAPRQRTGSYFLSEDDQFDPQQDFLLGRFNRDCELPAGGACNFSDQVTLPGVFGSWHIIYVANSDGKTPDTDFSDNVAVVPINVTMQTLNLDQPVTTNLAAGEQKFFLVQGSVVGQQIVVSGPNPTRAEVDSVNGFHFGHSPDQRGIPNQGGNFVLPGPAEGFAVGRVISGGSAAFRLLLSVPDFVPESVEIGCVHEGESLFIKVQGEGLQFVKHVAAHIGDINGNHLFAGISATPFKVAGDGTLVFEVSAKTFSDFKKKCPDDPLPTSGSVTMSNYDVNVTRVITDPVTGELIGTPPPIGSKDVSFDFSFTIKSPRANSPEAEVKFTKIPAMRKDRDVQLQANVRGAGDEPVKAPFGIVTANNAMVRTRDDAAPRTSILVYLPNPAAQGSGASLVLPGQSYQVGFIATATGPAPEFEFSTLDSDQPLTDEFLQQFLPPNQSDEQKDAVIGAARESVGFTIGSLRDAIDEFAVDAGNFGYYETDAAVIIQSLLNAADNFGEFSTAARGTTDADSDIAVFSISNSIIDPSDVDPDIVLRIAGKGFTPDMQVAIRPGGAAQRIPLELVFVDADNLEVVFPPETPPGTLPNNETFDLELTTPDVSFMVEDALKTKTDIDPTDVTLKRTADPIGTFGEGAKDLLAFAVETLGEDVKEVTLGGEEIVVKRNRKAPLPADQALYETPFGLTTLLETPTGFVVTQNNLETTLDKQGEFVKQEDKQTGEKTFGIKVDDDLVGFSDELGNLRARIEKDQQGLITRLTTPQVVKDFEFDGKRLAGFGQNGQNVEFRFLGGPGGNFLEGVEGGGNDLTVDREFVRTDKLIFDAVTGKNGVQQSDSTGFSLFAFIHDTINGTVEALTGGNEPADDKPTKKEQQEFIDNKVRDLRDALRLGQEAEANAILAELEDRFPVQVNLFYRELGIKKDGFRALFGAPSFNAFDLLQIQQGLARLESTLVTSSDPNDILGPDGFGAEEFINVNAPLDYTIRFENLAAATAPAQEVFIEQTLDADLDLDTFEFTGFGFRDRFFTQRPGLQDFQEIIDDPETGLLVSVTGTLNRDSREIRWVFRSLDPQTGDLTPDPLGGFLPPDVNDGEGEGFVSYAVRAKTNSVTGDVIDAAASIIFDTNDPIATPLFSTRSMPDCRRAAWMLFLRQRQPRTSPSPGPARMMLADRASQHLTCLSRPMVGHLSCCWMTRPIRQGSSTAKTARATASSAWQPTTLALKKRRPWTLRRLHWSS